MLVSALLNSLTEAESMLVRETEPAHLAALDEDDLAALHTRVHRARNKYVKLYRREASGRVAEYGGRGKARPKNTRNSQKAEVFEDALARVSRALAAAARRSANALKAERLEAVRRERNTTPPAVPRRPPAKRASQRARSLPSSAPAVRKRQASTKAAGARRQAAKDSR